MNVKTCYGKALNVLLYILSFRCRNELFNTNLGEQRKRLYGDSDEQQKSFEAVCKEMDISAKKFF